MTTTASTANSGVADQAGSLAGAARVAARPGPGSARRPGRSERSASQAASATATAATSRPRGPVTTTAPITARTSPTAISAETAARGRRRRDERPPRARPRPGRASPRRARAWSGRAAGRDRPTAAARRPRRGSARRATIACSTDETCSTRSRTGVVGGGPGRDAVGDVGRGADRFARDDDEPGVERGVVDGDPVEAVADLERDPLAAVLEGRPSASSRRTWRRVRRKTSGRWASSSNSSSASIRPADPDVARRTGGQRRAPRRR